MLVALALKTAEETTPVENVLCSVTPHRWIFFFLPLSLRLLFLSLIADAIREKEKKRETYKPFFGLC
jgi:hypothetical protein